MYFIKICIGLQRRTARNLLFINLKAITAIDTQSLPKVHNDEISKAACK